MTSIDLLIALAVVVYICARQLTWRLVDPARMWKLPAVLGAAGVVSIAQQATTFRAVDIVILGLSAVFALVSGTLMGRLARFRPAQADPRRNESRTGWRGVGVWLGLIAARIALDVAGHRLGSDLGISTGTILLVLGLNRAASAFVIAARQPRAAYALAGK